jgi:Uma2 family endonuclease
MGAAAKIQTWMSVAEFLAWAPQDARRWQLVDGEPRMMAPPNAVHGFLQAELGAVIRNHLRAAGLPCDVFTNPGVVPKTISAHNMRVPDLAVSCAPFAIGQAAPSDPVLIVEILSPGTKADTWANVWAYTSIPSVREILILRADAIAADLLRRQADDAWPAQSEPVVADLALDSIGLRLPFASLYARTPLAEMEAG